MTEQAELGAAARGDQWIGASAAVSGARHIARNSVCQDAAGIGTLPRHYCIVADGKGSSAISHLGANDAVAKFAGILALLEPLIVEALDVESLSQETRDDRWTRAAQWIGFLLAEEQRTLARDHGSTPAMLEYTLAAVIIGTYRVGWIQIGDASIVVEVGEALALVEEPDTGPFANTTVFLRHPLCPSHIRAGAIPAANLNSVAVCSDGAAFHFLELGTLVPAEAFAQIFEAVRAGQCTSTELQALLAAPRWSESHGDDRALAVLARQAPRAHAVNALTESCEQSARHGVIAPASETPSTVPAECGIPLAEQPAATGQKCFRRSPSL